MGVCFCIFHQGCHNFKNLTNVVDKQGVLNVLDNFKLCNVISDNGFLKKKNQF
jgi:hypothetical protein